MKLKDYFLYLMSLYVKQIYGGIIGWRMTQGLPMTSMTYQNQSEWWNTCNLY